MKIVVVFCDEVVWLKIVEVLEDKENDFLVFVFK